MLHITELHKSQSNTLFLSIYIYKNAIKHIEISSTVVGLLNISQTNFFFFLPEYAKDELTLKPVLFSYVKLTCRWLMNCVGNQDPYLYFSNA